ncbi:MAG: hypothetical protein LBC18_13500 [Opitutaceae bacterium]|jgi:hypothetical protein|nr:hypothetical protein [Opitutaceae bacterium]
MDDLIQISPLHNYAKLTEKDAKFVKSISDHGSQALGAPRMQRKHPPEQVRRPPAHWATKLVGIVLLKNILFATNLKRAGISDNFPYLSKNSP